MGRTVALLTVLLLAAGCGDGENSQDTQPSPTGGAGSPAAPYGIDGTDWPDDLDAVRTLARGLPAVDGAQVRVSRAGPATAGMLFAEYPRGGPVLIVSAPQEGLHPDDVLAATFGLVYSCARGSFAGSATGIPGGSGGAAPTAGDAERWFTCEVAGAEGRPHFRGSAVGWTSGPLAWLVVAGDERTARALVAGLRSSAGR